MSTSLTAGRRNAHFYLVLIIVIRVFDVSCGIHASKSWVMGAPIR